MLPHHQCLASMLCYHPCEMQWNAFPRSLCIYSKKEVLSKKFRSALRVSFHVWIGRVELSKYHAFPVLYYRSCKCSCCGSLLHGPTSSYARTNLCMVVQHADRKEMFLTYLCYLWWGVQSVMTIKTFCGFIRGSLPLDQLPWNGCPKHIHGLITPIQRVLCVGS